MNTCLTEGFGNNFIQAWLQGKPVVSYEFDPGGLIESEKLGFVSNQNINQFIVNVKKLIENPTLNKEIGERASKYAHKNFQSDKNVRKLEFFLMNIIQNSNLDV